MILKQRVVIFVELSSQAFSAGTPTVITQRDETNWADLIHDAKSGDENAINAIMLRLRTYLLAVAARKSNGRMAAKFGNSDIVQQTLLDAHQGLDDFKGSSQFELRAWLKTILQRNLHDFRRNFSTRARDVRRERFVEHHVSSTRPDETPSQLLSKCETDQQLLDAVEKLPERQRFVVEARQRWNWNYSEIAAELNITEVAARKLWSRALKNLKESIALD